MKYAYHMTLEKRLGAIAIQGLVPSKKWGCVWFSRNEFDYPPMDYCHGALLRFPLPEKYEQDINGGSANTNEYVVTHSIHSGVIGILNANKRWVSLESFIESDDLPYQMSIDFYREYANITL